MKQCKCGRRAVVEVTLPDGLTPYCLRCLGKYFKNCKKAFGID